MNAKNNMYVNTKMDKKINEFINLRVILFLSTINECRGGVRGGREGAFAPPDLPNLYIYIFFMCVVVKGGDLIEIMINSA